MMAERRKLDQLEKERPLLLDGAYGTLLMGMGLPAGRPPDEWNLLHPDLVTLLHENYIEAGARIILTNTFGSNSVKLARSELGERSREMNLRGAELARKAAGRSTLVAGDMGPTGELLEPYGSLSIEKARRSFAEQAQALHEGGVDLIMIETMYDLREALCALEAALEATPLPVFASLTFEKRGSAFATIMGNRVAPALAELERAGATAVGANCSMGTSQMRELVRLMVDSTSLPVIAEPNAGEPRLKEGRLTYDATPEEFADHMLEIVEIGARVVGGCCGTDPVFIRTLRGRLDERGSGASA
jgi:5-methyltetrahydrofolate--homocysteine methyltransferase